MIPVAIIVVTHDSAAVLRACLDSAARTGAAEIVVVDNASTDATLEIARGVTVIANRDNRGFAAAVNQGVVATRSPHILLLNPDAQIVSGLHHLIAACEHVAGGKLVGNDGRVQAGFNIRRFPTPAALSFEALGLNRLWRNNPVNRRYRYLDLDLESFAEVEQPAGAFLIFRRDVWRALRGFDERFHPIWFEDVDFCKRAHDAGFSIRYEPRAMARHSGGHSIQSMPYARRTLCWYASLLKYAAKHFRPAGRWPVCAAVMFGSVPRAVTGTLAERSTAPLATYWKVVRLAVSYLRG
jgi:GT2 family glycosyltransferase